MMKALDPKYYLIWMTINMQSLTSLLVRSEWLHCRKRYTLFFASCLMGVVSLLGVVPPLCAAIVSTGDVEPQLPWSDWTTSYVGRTSDGSLTVDAGSVLQSYKAYVAHASGSTGSATITGAGSKWFVVGDYNYNCDLFVGCSGSGTLNIEAGAYVSNAHGEVVLGYSAGSTGIVRVTGVGSILMNDEGISVGLSGTGTLVVEAGAQVGNVAGALGNNSGSVGTATVTGAGSKWWVSPGDFYIGRDGSGNLTVADGGQVTAGTLYASLPSLHGNGTIAAEGAVLDADLQFDAAHRTSTTVPFGTGGTLTVKAKAGFGDHGVGYKGSGSMTVAEGVEILSSSGYLGYYPASTGTATVTGVGSKWTNYDYLYVGYKGGGELNIEAGGNVSSTNGYLGYESGSTGIATVIGTSSKWTNTGELWVGQNGSGILMATDGGQVTAETLYASLSSLQGNGTIIATKGAVLDADIRFDAAHGTQQTLVFGTGGTLIVNAVGGNLGAGYKGKGDLTVVEGVAIVSSSGHLGYYSGSLGTATVTGTGSKWTNTGALWVGRDGTGILRVESGAQVSSTSGYIGRYSGCGTATITGTDSKWINSSDLRIGYSGTGTLNIEAGGNVSNTTGYLGYEVGSLGTATVSGTGSKWTNTGDLWVGRNGNGTLTVADGGHVTAATLYASLSSFHGNGNITATKGAILDGDLRFDATHGTQQTLTFGTGGTLTVHTAGAILGAGYKGHGSINISEGASLTTSDAYLGYYSGSTGTAIVTGSSSKWTTSGSLYVGQFGHGTLNIEAGGQVTSISCYLGRNSGSGMATVTGTGSKWTNSSSLSVGHVGSGTLNISASGNVNSTIGYLGYDSRSTGTVTVTGIGSKWVNNSELYVGYSGTGTLTVADGGEVTTASLFGSLNSFHGNGRIAATKGAVLDAELRFAVLGGTQQTLMFGTGGTLTINAAEGILGAGYKGQGSLIIANGVAVASSSGYLGYYSGSTGAAMVTGTGTKWTNSSHLRVGYSGSGTLNIEGGAQVSSVYGTLGSNSESAGTATVIGIGSAWTNSSELNVGLNGYGILNIGAGAQATCNSGYLGRLYGSTGKAAVVGTGSQWNNSGPVCVGYLGNGTLTIDAGAQVSNTWGCLGTDPQATGTAAVTGADSTWDNSRELWVGHSGIGMLTVCGGGRVSAKSVSVNSRSLISIDAGYDSGLTVDGGSGTITNNGEVRVIAAPGAKAGQYSPIAAGTWDGTGTYQAIGGTWHSGNHVFTLSDVITGASDEVMRIDVGQKQRVVITDDQSGWRIGTSFVPRTGTIDFTVSVVSSVRLSALQDLIPPNQLVLGAWEFTITGAGYHSADPAYLSFAMEQDYSASDLQVWRLDGTDWYCFPAIDLTCNGGYASFTVSKLSGYAVSVVPEPSTIWLLASAAIALATMAIRRRLATYLP